jgi:hypothetical protein
VIRRRRQQQHKQLAQAIRRDRRRLGRFVVFAEMEADLRPVSLFDGSAPRGSTPPQEAQIQAMREQSTGSLRLGIPNSN